MTRADNPDTTVTGLNCTITINNTAFRAKASMTGVIGCELNQLDVPGGKLNTFTGVNNSWEAEVVVDSGNLGNLLRLTQPDANHNLRRVTVVVEMDNLRGTGPSISGTASVYQVAPNIPPAGEATATASIVWYGPVSISG